MTGGQPFTFHSGFVVLIPAIGPSIRVPAIGTVFGPTFSTLHRHPVDISIHDRFTLDDQAAFVQHTAKLGTWLQDRFSQAHFLLMQPGLQFIQVCAFRCIPAFLPAIPFRARRPGRILFGIGHIQPGFLRSRFRFRRRQFWFFRRPGYPLFHNRCYLPALFFAAHDVLPDQIGVPCGTYDFERILFQRLDPAGNVGVVLARIMSNAQIHAQHVAGDFGAQLLTGVFRAAKRMSQELPSQTGFMARPVPQLMQSRGIIPIGRGELFLRREMNRVF